MRNRLAQWTSTYPQTCVQSNGKTPVQSRPVGGEKHNTRPGAKRRPMLPLHNWEQAHLQTRRDGRTPKHKPIGKEHPNEGILLKAIGKRTPEPQARYLAPQTPRHQRPLQLQQAESPAQSVGTRPSAQLRPESSGRAFQPPSKRTPASGTNAGPASSPKSEPPNPRHQKSPPQRAHPAGTCAVGSVVPPLPSPRQSRQPACPPLTKSQEECSACGRTKSTAAGSSKRPWTSVTATLHEDP